MIFENPRYVSNHIRLAIANNVDHDSGIIHTIWMDQEGGTGPDIPIPHPFAGKGGEGIFVGIRSGSIIALDMAASERYVPVAVLPMRAYYGTDLSSVSEIQFDEIEYHRRKSYKSKGTEENFFIDGVCPTTRFMIASKYSKVRSKKKITSIISSTKF